MELEYNGVKLELLTLDRVERRSVYTPDGVDLLYVEWLIGAACVYAPNGHPVGTAVTQLSPSASRMAYGGDPRGGPPIGVPLVLDPVRQQENRIGGALEPGLTAALTDIELRQRLHVPRRGLVITAYDQDGKRVEWLRSPRLGDTVDANNGPTPLSVDVLDATGAGDCLGVYFQIKTCQTPCPAGSDRLVLAHRWQMSHVHDDNYYLTRVIQGEIHFNGAAIAATGIRPDDVRNQFIHPIPLGFRRGGPQISQSADGLVINYTIADTDTSVTFDPANSGATQMSIAEKTEYQSPWSV